MDRQQADLRNGPGLSPGLLNRNAWIVRKHSTHGSRTGAQEFVTFDHVQWRRTIHLLTFAHDTLWNVATRYLGEHYPMPRCLLMRGDPGFELHFRVIIRPRRYAEHETQPSDSDERPLNE